MQHKNRKLTSSMLALLFAASVLTSCIGDLDVKPRDPNLTQEFHQDGVFARLYASLALTGLEGPSGIGDLAGIIDEGTSSFIRLMWNLQTLTTDEGICAWGDPGIPELNFNQWGDMHDQINGMFARLYFNITLANHFLEQTEGLTDERTRRQRAEARFLRALNWFYLMDMFGDVVFIDRVPDDFYLPERISRADLFDYIIRELTEIEADMFPPRQAPRYRADQAANWLLKSRVFLNAEVYTGTARWTEAAAYARRVMDSAYELAPVYAHLFMADNDGSGTVNQAYREIILPIAQHGVHIRSWGAMLFLIASTRTEGMPAWGSTHQWGGNRARQALVHKFFPNGDIPAAAFINAEQTLTGGTDQRAMFFIHRNIAGDAADRRPEEIRTVGTFRQGFSVVKFTNLRADGGPTSDAGFVDTDFPLLRAAEAYLTFAEATIRGGGDASAALTAINAIRTRAGAPAFTPPLTLDMILDERAREFFFEGHRRTDLIRFGSFGGGTYVWDWKGGVEQGARISAHLNVFPIPAGQLVANPNLRQNLGY